MEKSKGVEKWQEFDYLHGQSIVMFITINKDLTYNINSPVGGEYTI